MSNCMDINPRSEALRLALIEYSRHFYPDSLKLAEAIESLTLRDGEYNDTQPGDSALAEKLRIAAWYLQHLGPGKSVRNANALNDEADRLDNRLICVIRNGAPYGVFSPRTGDSIPIHLLDYDSFCHAREGSDEAIEYQRLEKLLGWA